MSQAKVTPQSSYSGPVVVDPLTRIEGHLRIEVEVENGRVKDARSCSTAQQLLFVSSALRSASRALLFGLF